MNLQDAEIKIKDNLGRGDVMVGVRKDDGRLKVKIKINNAQQPTHREWC